MDILNRISDIMEFDTVIIVKYLCPLALIIMILMNVSNNDYWLALLNGAAFIANMFLIKRLKHISIQKKGLE